MSGPITWRNVTAPAGVAEAGALFQGAQRSFTGAFDTLGTLLKQREATAAANVDVENAAQKQGYLDLLQGAKTPEELAALQPQIDAMRANLTSVNRGATSAAQEARMTSLRQGALASNAYTEQQADIAEKPLINETMAAIAKGDIPTAHMLAQNVAVRDRAKLINAVTAKEQAVKQLGQTEEDRKYLVGKRPLEMDNLRGQNELDKINLTTAKQTAEDAASNRKMLDTLSERANVYQTSAQATKAQHSGVADYLIGVGTPIPRNTDGSVNYDMLTTATGALFDDALRARGIPLRKTVAEGNTAAVNAAVDSLRQQGFKASDIAKAQAVAPGMFGTTPQAAVGNDAASAERAMRIQEAADEATRMQFGEVATPGTLPGLFDSAMEDIGKLYKPNSWKHETARKTLAKFYESGGITVKDDKGKPMMDASGKVPIRVLPSAEAMKRIVNATPDPWYGVGGGSLNPFSEDFLQEQLTKWAANPENIKGAAARYDEDLVKKLRNVDRPNRAQEEKKK